MRVAIMMLLLAACNGGDDGGGSGQLTFGGDRPVDLKVPAGVTPDKRYPLIVVLHGYGETGFIQAAYFGVSMLPAMDQAFLLAPDGKTDSAGKQFWNADPQCCDLDGTHPDDVGYIGGLIDDVTAAWPQIDTKQVFVIGHSNGAFMAYRMACERADAIAAIGALAGYASSMPATCNPTQPVNVLHMHGTADTTVPYGPTSLIGDVGALGSVDQWQVKNGCATTRASAGADLDLVSDQPGAETHRTKADACPANGAVELWTITGAGHIPVWNAAFMPTLVDWLGAHGR